MKRLIEKQQIFILLVATIVIAGFIILRFIPIARQARNIGREKKEHKALIEQIQINNSQLPMLRTKVAELHERADLYEKRIPVGRGFASLWQQIADVMNKHELTDQLVKPGVEIKGEKVNCIPISIECKGSLEQIYGLFRSLEKFERLIKIEHVKLTNNKDYSGHLKMLTRAKVYYQSNKAQEI